MRSAFPVASVPHPVWRVQHYLLQLRTRHPYRLISISASSQTDPVLLIQINLTSSTGSVEVSTTSLAVNMSSAMLAATVVAILVDHSTSTGRYSRINPRRCWRLP